MDIEVGEYVRTKEGYIAKCIEIDEDGEYFTFDNYLEIQYGDKFYSLYDSELNKITKHSKNIIDLIEVGDFVNGMEVLNIKNKTIYVEWSNEFDEYTGFVDENTIETILTHEMYEANCYRLEGTNEQNNNT